MEFETHGILLQNAFSVLNNNNNLFIYSALFNMLGDQKRILCISQTH